eukprot:RCo050849
MDRPHRGEVHPRKQLLQLRLRVVNVRLHPVQHLLRAVVDALVEQRSLLEGLPVPLRQQPVHDPGVQHEAREERAGAQHVRHRAEVDLQQLGHQRAQLGGLGGRGGAQADAHLGAQHGRGVALVHPARPGQGLHHEEVQRGHPRQRGLAPPPALHRPHGGPGAQEGHHGAKHAVVQEGGQAHHHQVHPLCGFLGVRRHHGDRARDRPVLGGVERRDLQPVLLELLHVLRPSGVDVHANPLGGHQGGHHVAAMARPADAHPPHPRHARLSLAQALLLHRVKRRQGQELVVQSLAVGLARHYSRKRTHERKKERKKEKKTKK